MNDIVDISKIEANKLNIQEENVDFHDLVNSLVTHWELKRRKRILFYRFLLTKMSLNMLLVMYSEFVRY